MDSPKIDHKAKPCLREGVMEIRPDWCPLGGGVIVWACCGIRSLTRARVIAKLE